VAIWAIADLHLALSLPEKRMDLFGEPWIGYVEQIQSHWRELIHPEDLVLIPGDISWAMRPEQARLDLEWIDHLPGTKVLLRGNHDYWWTSLRQIEKVLPPSLHLIQNNVFCWNHVCIGGARLWDSSEYHFDKYIRYIPNPRANPLTEEAKQAPDQQKIFQRELQRLEISLQEMAKQPHPVRIAMTHYPPIGAELAPSQASALLEEYGAQICVFGHLHNVKSDVPLFGTRHGIRYHLVSADYLGFIPLKIQE
jgi:predicted phosphohydrolase